MSHLSVSTSRASRAFAALFDREIEDDLLRHLVASVFGGKPTLYASIVMSLLMIVTAMVMTGSSFLAIVLACQVIVGLSRVSIVDSFHRRDSSLWKREELLRVDRAFTVWASMQALLLGATFYYLETPALGAVGLPLAVGGTVGFCVAFVTRSPSRIRLLILQVGGLLAPVIFGLLTLGVPFGFAYAALYAGLALSTVLMGLAARARIIEHFRINDTNRKMARCDMLTGILNRFSFNDALSRALEIPESAFALITIDIDRFKEINDGAGHLIGDKVLVEMARRLVASTQSTDVVARIGGDEFVVIAALAPSDTQSGSEIAARLVSALAAPFDASDAPLSVGASVGVALFPQHGVTVEELMKRSDIALYEAKVAGRGVHRVFDETMQSRFDDARLLEAAIETALRQDQFEAWFQPIQDLASGEVIGYEALARWRHPELGLIPPDRFIPIAERNGAIVAIGQAIIEKACVAAAIWDGRLSLAVNLSPVQFRNAENLVQTVLGAIAGSGLHPSRLYLEITESLMLEDSPATRAAVHTLTATGVRFALDDFGAGYSSLSYIHKYPFAKIKIDRSFVDRLGQDQISAAIIASVCTLAQRLDLEVCAEGVETRAQQASLKSLGVGQGQGYLFGKPLPYAHGERLMDYAESA